MESGCCEVKRQVRASWWSARDKCGTDRRALTWASWHFWLSGLYLPSLSCQWAMRPSRRFRDTVKSLLPVFRGETRSVRNINLKHSSKDRFIYRIKDRHIIMDPSYYNVHVLCRIEYSSILFTPPTKCDMTHIAFGGWCNYYELW